jgi:hypothetical protein
MSDMHATPTNDRIPVMISQIWVHSWYFHKELFWHLHTYYMYIYNMYIFTSIMCRCHLLDLSFIGFIFARDLTAKGLS